MLNQDNSLIIPSSGLVKKFRDYAAVDRIPFERIQG